MPHFVTNHFFSYPCRLTFSSSLRFLWDKLEPDAAQNWRLQTKSSPQGVTVRLRQKVGSSAVTKQPPRQHLFSGTPLSTTESLLTGSYTRTYVSDYSIVLSRGYFFMLLSISVILFYWWWSEFIVENLLDRQKSCRLNNLMTPEYNSVQCASSIDLRTLTYSDSWQFVPRPYDPHGNNGLWWSCRWCLPRLERGSRVKNSSRGESKKNDYDQEFINLSVFGVKGKWNLLSKHKFRQP